MDVMLEEALEKLDRSVVPHRTLRIPASDGFPLAATLFVPCEGTDTDRVVILNAATGVRRRYYDRYAAFLTHCGFTVLTYDYRGIGDSRPQRLRGFRARMREWGERDVEGVLLWAASELGAERPSVIGHSVGGQVLGMAPSASRVRAVVMVGAQNGDYRYWSGVDRARALLFWFGVVPTLTRTLGYLPGAVLGGEDLPAGVAREWAEWGRRRGYLAGGRDAARATVYAGLRFAVRAYSFSDDSFAPRGAVDALLRLYANAPSTHVRLRPEELGVRSIGHFGFFRAKFEQTLWADSVAWLRDPAQYVDRFAS